MDDSNWKEFKKRLDRKHSQRSSWYKLPKFLKVQLHYYKPTGPGFLYPRIGQRQLVPFVGCALTLPAIKKSCERFFTDRNANGATCDVLQSERGPSCLRLRQVRLEKTIHVRFAPSLDMLGWLKRSRDKAPTGANGERPCWTISGKILGDLKLGPPTIADGRPSSLGGVGSSASGNVKYASESTSGVSEKATQPSRKKKLIILAYAAKRVDRGEKSADRHETAHDCDRNLSG